MWNRCGTPIPHEHSKWPLRSTKLSETSKDELVGGYEYDVSNVIDFVSRIQKETITGVSFLPTVVRGQRGSSALGRGAPLTLTQ